MEVCIEWKSRVLGNKPNRFAALYYSRKSVYLDVLLWAELINLNSVSASSNYSVINTSTLSYL